MPSLPESVAGSFETVFLCVKAQDTADAAAALRPHLAPAGCVVSAQNGLNEPIIAEAVGVERTVGCFVNFGADYMGPGVVMYGGRGAVVVGELDGAITPRAERLHALLRDFEPDAHLTANIWGYLWSKLIYGALLFATALTDDSIADVLADRRFRPTLAELGREVARVAAAEGCRPGGLQRLRSARLQPRRAPTPRSSTPSTTWSPSTAARPSRTAASGAIWPYASGAPRSTPSSSRFCRSRGGTVSSCRCWPGWSS